MAKQPSKKKRLMYKGAIYEAVELPSSLMYKGVVYTAVHQYRTAQPPEEDLKSLRDIERTLKSVPGGEAVKPLTPEQLEESRRRFERMELEKEREDEEELPAPEIVKPRKELIKKEDLLKYLEPFIASLRNTVKSELDKFDIKTSGDIKVEADEADGIDMVAPIATAGFSALPETSLSFDYAINLPEKDLQILRDKKLTNIEQQGFAGRLLLNIKNLGRSRATLVEVLFFFCKHGFAGTGRTVAELLDTVGFLQNASKVRPGTLLTLPPEKASEKNIKEWASEIFKQIIENEMHHHAGVDIYRKSEWGRVSKMEEVIAGLGAKKILGADQVNLLKQVLKGLKAQEYAQLIRDILAPSGGGERFSLRVLVEKKVAELTKHEKYTGGVKFGIAKDGNIIAAIDAPYPFQYVFKQSPGGRVELLEAGTEICDFSFIENTEQGAKKLLTASLNLSDAYKRAVNPSVSENRKERDAEELYLKIHDLSKRLEEEEGKRITTVEEKPPTGEEATGGPGRQPAQRT